jgi:ubiquinone biosynthesis protein COQ4
LAYLVRRFRQSHDVWHTISGLGGTREEEIALQAFCWGQLGLPLSRMAVLLGSVRLMLLKGRWQMAFCGMRNAYRSGRAAAQLLPIRWEELWDQPLEQVRARLSIQPCSLESV